MARLVTHRSDLQYLAFCKTQLQVSIREGSEEKNMIFFFLSENEPFMRETNFTLGPI